MKHSHGSHAMHAGMNHGGESMKKDIAKSTVTSATVFTGGKIMKQLTKHPLVVFGLGVAAGYFVYKYRKSIISSTSKAVGAGKDFVQNQKENLEDIVAEAKETD